MKDVSRGSQLEEKRAKERYKAYKRNKSSKKRMIVFLLLLVAIGLGIFVYIRYMNIQEEEPQVEQQEGALTIEKITDATTEDSNASEKATEGSSEELVIDLDEEITVDEVEEKVEEYLSSMNLESRVGQLFITSPEELTGVGIVVQAGETTKQMLKEYSVGGLILTEQNFEVIDQMKLMLTSIEVYSSTPIFLVMDELGAVRITNTNNSLADVGFDMLYEAGELYFVRNEEEEKVSEYLNVIVLEEQDIIEEIKSGGEMFIVLDDFKDVYDEVLSSARNGELEESIIEERVREILTYKVQNNL